MSKLTIVTQQQPRLKCRLGGASHMQSVVNCMPTACRNCMPHSCMRSNNTGPKQPSPSKACHLCSACDQLTPGSPAATTLACQAPLVRRLFPLFPPLNPSPLVLGTFLPANW